MINYNDLFCFLSVILLLKIPFLDNFVKDISPLKDGQTDPDPWQIILVPDPGKNSRSLRIRIHTTELVYSRHPLIFLFQKYSSFYSFKIYFSSKQPSNLPIVRYPVLQSRSRPFRSWSSSSPTFSGTGSQLLQPQIRECLLPVLRIRIQIGSIFSDFVDPDPYSEYGLDPH